MSHITDEQRWQFLMRLQPEWIYKHDIFKDEYHVRIGFRSFKKYDSLADMIDAGIDAESESVK